ncbi:MAG: hypothetical protein WAW39_14640, partial [Prosthecobacter sp.]
EEMEEFIASGSSEEIADIYEVLDTLMGEMKIDKTAVLSTQQQKRKEKGGFEKRIILESSEKKQ